MLNWRKKIIALLFLLALVLWPGDKVSNTQAQQVQSGIGVSITIEGATPTPEQPSTGGGGGGVYTIPVSAVVTLKGFSYPGALVTFLKNGATIGNTLADADGIFEKIISTDSGISTFGIWGKDQFGINSQTTNVTISLVSGTRTTVSNIVLSPTIALDKTVITQGQKITIFGSATPRSNVRIFNNYSPGQLLAPIKAKENGRWEYVLDTLALQPGEYSLRANAQLEVSGLISSFSSNILFNIEKKKCFGSDLNNDGQVDTTDFSILMFYWNKSLDKMETKPVNACADTNGDGLIGLVDFSVMMYKWTA